MVPESETSVIVLPLRSVIVNWPSVPSGSRFSDTSTVTTPLIVSISTFTVVPRIPIVATGVFTSIPPVLATWPAIKTKVPSTKLKTPELELLAGSYISSSSTIRDADESVNIVPSTNVREREPPSAVCTTSLAKTLLFNCSGSIVPSARRTVAPPLIFSTWPIASAPAGVPACA